MMKARAYAVLLPGLLALSLAGCAGIGESLSTGFGLWGNVDNSEKPVALPQFTPTISAHVEWQAAIGPAGDYVFTPAIAGDAVYAASGNALARFDAASGRQVWRVDPGRTLSAGVGTGEGLVMVGTPKGDVLAYDPDGKAVWQAKVSSEVLAAPQAAEGVVVVRCVDGQVFGLDAHDGKRKWVYQRTLPALALRSYAGVTIARGAVFVGYAGGKLAALALSGGNVGWEASVAQPRGATELERIADVTSVPVVDNGRVCAVAFQGRAACFEIVNGNPLWTRDMSSITGLSQDASYFYTSDAGGAVHALDKGSGATVWKQDKLANRRLTLPLPVGNYVAVGDVEGNVLFLSREDGSFAAHVPTDGSAIAAAPQSSGLDVVVQTRKGGVFAVGTGH